MQKRKKVLIFSFFLLLIIALITVLLVDLAPLFKEIVQTANSEQAVSYIGAYGAKGVPLIIAMQALQVVVVFFPAAAVQVLAGLCYGVWLGALLSIVGYILGNILVFIAVRRFRQNFGAFRASKSKHPRKFFNAEKIKTMKTPEYTAFLLYLIPGIPSGPLPYLFAATPISFGRYLAAVTFASIPSVLFCSWLGELVARRNYTLAVILIAAGTALVVLLFLFRKKIQEKIEKISNRHSRVR